MPRCPIGTRKNKQGECVGVLTKRCQNGTRKNKHGQCIPKKMSSTKQVKNTLNNTMGDKGKHQIKLAQHLRNGVDISKINWDAFCANSHDIAVEWILTGNRSRIDWQSFSKNSNDRAVHFMLQPENIDNIRWREFSLNSNTIAVQYLLQNKRLIDWKRFNKNKNTLAVQYLLKHPRRISINEFSCNSNDLAVEYLLQPTILPTEFITNDNGISFNFNTNENTKAVHYILNEIPNLISIQALCANSNDIAVDYVLPIIQNNLSDDDDENELIDTDLLSTNTNPRVVEYMLTVPEYIKWSYFSANESIFKDFVLF